MNKLRLLTCAMLWGLCANAFAASPLPSFDKTAVTEYPWYRTGQQRAETENQLKKPESYRPGNTGTEENPAFYIKRIRLTGFVLPEVHNETRLQDILDAYTNRSVAFDELQVLTEAITKYARDSGFTVSQAVVPAQEIRDGQLEIAVYVSVYDDIKMVSNTSRVADRVLVKFLGPLKKDVVITDKKLERVLNDLNDLPGVIARGSLYPGSRPLTTGLDVEILRRPVWNNYVFVDNGGSQISGRWRYGFHTEINNPGQQGDKIGVTGSISNKHTKNYAVNYETAIGSRGTRWGVGFSRTSYDIGWHRGSLNQYGDSEAVSFYGLTPVYRDKEKRVTALYGYDYRRIKDTTRFRFPGFIYSDDVRKRAHVLHAGIAASEYQPNRFTYGDIIYWYGDIDAKDQRAYFEGAYHKLTADFKHVRYWKDWNVRLEAHGQIANRGLDGSERFYLGGMNGVRAYPASETSGDTGYTATLEVRRRMDVEGLEVAAFVDAGEVTRNKGYGGHRNLAGWGLGLRYARENDWYAQFDYAWKINGEPYESEEHDHRGRMWLQIYKMF